VLARAAQAGGQATQHLEHPAGPQ